MTTIDKFAIVWSIAIVVIGVGVAFYGSVGGDVTNPTSSNISISIDRGAEAIEETIVEAEEVIGEGAEAIEGALSSKTFTVSIPSGTSSPECETTNECYIPEKITAKVGDTISWLNDDTVVHTVTGGNPANGLSGVFDSGLIGNGETFEFIFNEVGNYEYFCIVHPWMIGSVTIEKM